MEKNCIRIRDFIKLFTNACAMEQETIFWVKAYDGFYGTRAQIVRDGEILKESTLTDSITLEDDFIFKIPTEFKTAMYDFKKKVNDMIGLFNLESGFELSLKEVSITINAHEVIGIEYRFKWDVIGVYGDNQPLILNWKKKEVESNVIDFAMKATFAGIRFHEKIEEWIKNGVVADYDGTFKGFEDWLIGNPENNEKINKVFKVFGPDMSGVIDNNVEVLKDNKEVTNG